VYKTKVDAENAVEDLNGKEIEGHAGRKVSLDQGYGLYAQE
jgi:hypothetical protein